MHGKRKKNASSQSSKSAKRTSLTVFLSLSPFWRCCWEDEFGTARLFDEASRETTSTSNNERSMFTYIVFECTFDDWWHRHCFHALVNSTLVWLARSKKDLWDSCLSEAIGKASSLTRVKSSVQQKKSTRTTESQAIWAPMIRSVLTG